MATLWIRNKPDVYKNGRPAKLRWSIIQVDADRRGYGRKEGHRGRDCRNNGRDNYVFYRVHVPGISPLLKKLIEQPVSAEIPAWGEFPPEYDAVYPRSYYLDVDALPETAQLSIQSQGECTLTPAAAYQAIKRRDTETPDAELLTCFRAV